MPANNQLRQDESVELWEARSIPVLIEHLRATHQEWLQNALPRLDHLIEAAVHRCRTEPARLLLKRFVKLRQGLEGHCRIEETVVFPAILAMQQSLDQGQTLPKAAFGSIRNPIAMLLREHDDDTQEWIALHNLAVAHADSAQVLEQVRSLPGELAAFQASLESHTRLEDAVLFPRALQLESGEPKRGL